MASLLAAAAVFIGIHFLVSGTRLRGVIVNAIGEGPYLGLFSLASIVSLVWLALAFADTRLSVDNRQLYDLGVGVRHLAIPSVAIAFFLAVQGLLLPNPTSVRQERAVSKQGVVQGVLRITRHPFLWGVAVWAAFHLAANGDTASVIFFSTFLATAIGGTFVIDAKCRRKLGDAWTTFARETSNIPFAANLRGQPLKIGELFGWRFLVAALLFLVFLFAHARLFGHSAFPNGWVPF